MLAVVFRRNVKGLRPADTILRVVRTDRDKAVFDVFAVRPRSKPSFIAQSCGKLTTRQPESSKVAPIEPAAGAAA